MIWAHTPLEIWRAPHVSPHGWRGPAQELEVRSGLGDRNHHLEPLGIGLAPPSSGPVTGAMASGSADSGCISWMILGSRSW